MDDWLSRQNSLIGEKATQTLKNARVAVIGLGGVGGAALEGVVRSGVGNILVMDCDVFEQSNLNRQILATADTLGRNKSDAAKMRILSINPAAEVISYNERFSQETSDLVFDFKPDFVIDAIDSVSAKLALIESCAEKGIQVVSSMGTGNRLDASGFRIGKIEDTAGCGCPLARVMRRELKKRGIAGVPVLYNTDEPIQRSERTPASISFVPPVAGYMLAGYVVKKIAGL